MTRRKFNLGSEPTGAEWRALVDALRPWATCVQLVVRDELSLASRAQALLEFLAPHLRERVRARGWPGTTLTDGDATLLRYAPDALPLIVAEAPGLFAWCQPDLPEDLTVFGADGALLLASIAHERDGWLELSEVELAAVEASAPGLVRRS